MRKICVCVAILVLAVMVPSPAYASAGGGWELFDFLDGMGDFFSNVIGAISDGIDYLLSALKRLFIPRDDYFPRAQTRLRDALGQKFGGFLSLAQYLENGFKRLTAYKDTAGLFVLRFPNSHFFNGLTVDLLKDGKEVAALIRSALSGTVTLMTVAFCYRRVLALINT